MRSGPQQRHARQFPGDHVYSGRPAVGHGDSRQKETRASAAACVLGTVLIVSSRTPSSSDYSAAFDEDAAADTTLGDGLILAGAAVWATFLLRMSKHARTLPVVPLVIWRNVLIFLCYACWWAFDERFFRGGSEHMGFGEASSRR